ncbi:DUF6541 family protein [Arenicella xantha]|uniref:Uncharacterized protein n=1 Tax=Arenicella xantha TaxID=644221 RepID=A0A395JL57_9GAMM|nr:DUF6541 family protein [Arenicella xantha]RBP51502.1 hypothetical protein DFR28_102932 [Arenicella xantha]
MPIFYHLQAHIWIFYLFFVNGFLLTLIFAGSNQEILRLTRTFEAKVIASFALSLGVNGVVLAVFDLLDLSWEYVILLLSIISVLLALYIWKRNLLSNYVFRVGGIQAVIYILVGLVIFYNGALIEQISDAWWHMSLANKMALASSYTLEQGHLNSVSTRWYPPLWHANLALATKLSGEGLPVLWNAATVWLAVLKLMAYYLFALGLTSKKRIAVLSVFLFVLIPGMGVSYLRVSAWPSHVAYIFMFSLLFIIFELFNSFQRPDTGNVFKQVVSLLLNHATSIVVIILLATLIIFSHQLELLWVALSIVFYALATEIRQTLCSVDRELESEVLRLICRATMVCVVLIGFWLMYANSSSWRENTDVLFAYLGVMIIAVLIFLVSFSRFQKVNLFMLSASLVAVVFSIDYTHVYSLFDATASLPKRHYAELPLLSVGWFGGHLVVPGWHLQLRSAMLYSGVVALPLSCFLAYRLRNRAALFLAGNAVFAVLFCVSPYLYQWFYDATDYHSPWRISILIFTPIIFSLAIIESRRLFAMSKD